jgi:hypothetical protein
LLDEEQREDLPEVVIANALPAYVVPAPPLTAEQARAVEEGDAARWRVEQKVDALHAHPAARALNCGKLCTLHLRRPHPLRAGFIQDVLIRPACGRSDCPHCWRRRLTRTYRRAAACLLDAAPDSRLPRIEAVHIGEIHWLGWDTLDRSLRRQHGRGVGRLRVLRSDNTMLVVCAKPFPGSRPVTPAEALDIVSAAIDRLHKQKHSYRQLGKWNDASPPEWKLIRRCPKPFDLKVIQSELEALDKKVKRFCNSAAFGLIWSADSVASADALWSRCPTLALLSKSSFRSKSDTVSSAKTPEAEAPDTDEVFAGRYDFWDSQWT